MGKAFKPPESNRVCRYWITEHAVQRFRDRVEEEHRARGNHDLALLLDERIRDAISSKSVSVVIDSEAPNEDTTIVGIESRKGDRSVVVMRKHSPSTHQYGRKMVAGPETPSLAAITVLTSEMAAKAYTDGRWHIPNRPLAQKLALIKVAEPPPPPSDVAKPAPKERGSTIERIEFAKRILRARPNITGSGADGLCELIRAEFGTGMSLPTIKELRAAVLAEDAGPADEPRMAEAIRPVSALANVSYPNQTSTATRLAAALEVEARAGAALRKASTAHAEALNAHAEAKSAVEGLMAEIQASRNGE